MKEIQRLVKEICRVSECISPVLYDMSTELLHLVENTKLYTKEEVMEIIDRKEGIERDEE